ncbi:response regulator transcription factor [Arcanobacterium phocae]|uniref:DNA-binding response regulator, NarL/FixJ family, contains REC and HTH domains n=1 Tax=Arcanobacterium phocae TaxID=131112 RepID=A0A1H2LN81_9ACTO|nr:response regulator transcription factor [Arcanobacterium phocae]SDU82379.1 DNA-binding response regulator, NarL/FixJ family, contains REC and HTH domains [Arcanobacterium phocae]
MTRTIFIADDAALMRAGLSGILQRVGYQIVGEASSAPELVSGVRKIIDDGGQIDVVLTDVRMPPTMTDDGLRAADELRCAYPNLAVMVLSQYVAPAYAQSLFGSAHGMARGGIGYLLKERVSQVADFVTSLDMVAGGGVVVDPEVAAGLIRGRSTALAALTPREREVLELMARGLSNAQIQADLFLSAAAVSKHVANIFSKLGLAPGEENRRVRAVLTYLTETGGAGAASR